MLCMYFICECVCLCMCDLIVIKIIIPGYIYAVRFTFLFSIQANGYMWSDGIAKKVLLAPYSAAEISMFPANQSVAG